MNARMIAMVLSLFCINLPLQAQNATESISLPISAPAKSNKIDLNKADVSTLTGSFKGIGKKRAEAIVAYRERHKGFKSIEELAEVKGLGQHFMMVNKDKLKNVFVVN